METMTVMMPRSLTDENGAKKLIMGEFTVDVLETCDACGGDGWEDEESGEECRECGGECSWYRRVTVPWTTIKEIYAKAVKHFGNITPDIPPKHDRGVDVMLNEESRANEMNVRADTIVRPRLHPITLKEAKQFIADNHRHNKPPTGWKFGVGLKVGENLIGVATAGRPIARHMDDGLTLEVNRTCTDGTKNANSMLYGAVWRAAKAMGYMRCITYNQADETGSSLRAAGWVKLKELPPRKSWAESSVKGRDKRDPVGNGGVARVLWEIRRAA